MYNSTPRTVTPYQPLTIGLTRIKDETSFVPRNIDASKVKRIDVLGHSCREVVKIICSRNSDISSVQFFRQQKGMGVLLVSTDTRVSISVKGKKQWFGVVSIDPVLEEHCASIDIPQETSMPSEPNPPLMGVEFKEDTNTFSNVPVSDGGPNPPFVGANAGSPRKPIHVPAKKKPNVKKEVVSSKKGSVKKKSVDKPLRNDGMEEIAIKSPEGSVVLIVSGGWVYRSTVVDGRLVVEKFGKRRTLCQAKYLNIVLCESDEFLRLNDISMAGNDKVIEVKVATGKYITVSLFPKK